MAEREIKTILTLEDASFSKGLKAATSSVSAAKAEMQAAISSAGGLGKGFKQAAAQIKGLSNVVKAQKSQMGVLSKEYSTQKARLNDLKKAAEAARKENGEGSKEAEKAANAYAAQSAKVDDLRVKMANLTVEMNKSKDALKSKLTQPLQWAGAALKTFAKTAAAALLAGGAALVKFTVDSNESKKTFNTSLAESRGAFGKWSLFLEEEAKTAWKNLGLSQSAYLETASQIGAALQKGGMGVQQSAEWVSQAMELAGQLSEKYGVPVETVLNDIAKAAEGDTTALNKYGVEVKGINDKMSESDKAAIILKDAMDSAGQSAQLLDGQVAQSVNNSGEKLKAAWDNFKAGVGSSDDVADAAAEAAATFGADFASNLATFIHVAPDTFKAFASSFKENWDKLVWPEIQGLFHAEFGIDLPNWEQLKTDITTGFNDLFSAVPAWARTLFNLPSGSTLLGGNGVINSLKKSPGDAQQDQQNVHTENIEALAKVINEIDDARATDNVTKAVKALQSLLDTPQEKFLSQDQVSRLKNGLKDATSLQDVLHFIRTAYDQILESIDEEKLAKSSSNVQDSAEKTSESLDDTAKSAADAGADMKSAGEAAKEAAEAFSSAASGLSEIITETLTHHTGTQGSFAGGLWNVPRNDYLARLHSGEMVLTASQAAAYRAQAAAGGNVNNYNDSSAIYIDKYYQNSETDAQALLNAMSVMQRRQRRGYGMA